MTERCSWLSTGVFGFMDLLSFKGSDLMRRSLVLCLLCAGCAAMPARRASSLAVIHEYPVSPELPRVCVASDGTPENVTGPDATYDDRVELLKLMHYVPGEARCFAVRSGTLGREEILKVLRSHRHNMRRCYDTFSPRGGRSGFIAVRFLIDE